jgi:hypothetical protein
MAELLAGTEKGLFVSAVGGPTDEVGDLAGRSVSALGRDGHGTWWALVDGRAVWRARERGAWSPVAEMDDGEPALTCLLADGDRVLVGTAGAHLRRVADGSLRAVAAFEEAAGREEWYTPWGGPPDTRSLATDGAGAIYANVHVGGIVRSIDGADTWEPTIDIHTDVHQVIADPRLLGRVWAGLGDGGLARSDDRGGTWKRFTDGLHGTYVRAVAVVDGTVLVTASTGPSTRRAAVYRKPVDEDDAPFERCRDGLPEWFTENIDTGRLAAADGLGVIGTSAGEVFVSADAGVTWERAADGLPAVRVVAVA